MENRSQLKKIVREQPYPLLFATISGAHLYGFPSPDSDYDLRGIHILPVHEIVGLDAGRETIELSEVRDGREIDLVTHDVRKFFQLLLKRNGYVLEQLFSPLVVDTTPEHEELKEIAKGCITQHHAHHYLGFAETQWKLFEKESPRRVKPLLYVFRVLLTGIHLMRTAEIESNLVSLNDEAQLPYLDELVARKIAGPEASALQDADMLFYESEYRRLVAELEAARNTTSLPERPTSRDMLNDLLVRLRIQSGDKSMYGITYWEMAQSVEVPPENASTTCPVCGFNDAFSQPSVYDICERCGWEDDPVQLANPDSSCGANKESLNDTRAHWKKMMARWQREARKRSESRE